jgi:SAM-dependent methyltransferase
VTESETHTGQLFQSAAGMAAATNYTDWTFSLFARHVRGDVLEVGCGVGTFTSLIAAGGCRSLLSIDISPEAIAHCRGRINLPSVRVALCDVRTVTGAFDLIVCMNVLEHIEADEEALRHMLALLAPGGTLFLLVPAHPALFTEFDKEAGHFRRYTKGDLTRLLGSTAPPPAFAARQFYFNSVGALGYYVVYGLLKRRPRGDVSAEIGWFDRAVVPVLRMIERNGSPFGISLVTIVTRRDAC